MKPRRSKSGLTEAYPARATDVELVAQALATPWGYARAKLAMSLHPKQTAVLKDLFPEGSRVAFRCGNKVGKTSKVAVAAILHHCEVLGGLVVSSAGVKRQVEHQLWPALTGYQHLYPGWTFKGLSIRNPAGRERYLGFTAANEGNFQGFHEIDGPLLIVLDESAAIKDEIILAAEERCDPTRLLLMGSPLDPMGVFYQVCTALAGYYKQHKLAQLECLKEDGYWLDREVIERRIAKWGAEHPLVLSNVFADFALKVEGALLSLREWDAALEDGPNDNGSWKASNKRHAFLDFAAGRAENVLAVAQGNRAWIEAGWREKNTMAAVGEFVSRLNKLRREIGLQPEEVEGDADGMGIVFCHALAEAGWPVGEFHGGAAPRFTSGDYYNLIAEVWTEGTESIRKREWILDADDELKGQLVSRKTKRNSKGLMMLESKEDMTARGVPSPDRADALLGAIAPAPLRKSRSLVAGDENWAQQFAEQAAAGNMAGPSEPEGSYFG